MPDDDEAVAVTSAEILFSGCVSSNGGDRAIVETQYKLLKSLMPELRVTFADNRPESVRKMLPDGIVEKTASDSVAVPRGSGSLGRVLRRWDRSRVLLAAHLLKRGPCWLARSLAGERGHAVLERMAGYDGVVYCGGTSFVEAYWLVPKFYELALARALSIPVVLMTQSMGPWTQEANQRAMRRLARSASLVLLRDERSVEHLRAIHASTTHVHVLPDVVFALGDETSVVGIRARTLPDRHLRVAVSVRELANYQHFTATKRSDFVQSVAALVRHCVETRGAHVTFISTCQGVPDYWTDDSAVAAEIKALLPQATQDQVLVDDSFHTTAGLIAQFGVMDVLVATRLHAAILALVAGTVVLPIAYEFKTHTVFDSLGAGDLVLDADSVSGDSLIAAFEAFISQIDTRRGRLADRMADTIATAAQAGSLTVSALQADHT